LVVSDEKLGPLFSNNDVLQFRPKEITCFAHGITADGFSPASLTQGGISVRSSLNFALG
jgi:hypothetical protein